MEQNYNVFKSSQIYLGLLSISIIFYNFLCKHILFLVHYYFCCSPNWRYIFFLLHFLTGSSWNTEILLIFVFVITCNSLAELTYSNSLSTDSLVFYL